MRITNCPFCLSCQNNPLWTTKNYQLSQCGLCGMVYKSQSSEISAITVNKELYSDELLEQRKQTSKRLENVAKRRIKVLRDYIPANGKNRIANNISNKMGYKQMCLGDRIIRYC